MKNQQPLGIEPGASALPCLVLSLGLIDHVHVYVHVPPKFNCPAFLRMYLHVHVRVYMCSRERVLLYQLRSPKSSISSTVVWLQALYLQPYQLLKPQDVPLRSARLILTVILALMR